LSRGRNIVKKTSLQTLDAVLVFLRICMRYHVWVEYMYGSLSAIEIKIFFGSAKNCSVYWKNWLKLNV
jgi:hypothetical protein